MTKSLHHPLEDSLELPGVTLVYSILFFVAYMVLAQISMMLAVAPANVTPLYPPAGLAWAAAVLFGRRALPVIFISAAMANGLPIFSVSNWGGSLAAGLFIGAGEVVSVLAGCCLLARFREPGGYLLNVRDVVLFCLIALFWVVSPSIGVSALWLFNFVETENFLRVWLTWWLGDSIGILILLPLILVLCNLGLNPASSRWTQDAAGAMIAVAVVSLVVSLTQLPLWYLMTAICFFYATRLSHLGIVVVNVTIASVCVWANFFGFSSNGHYSPEVQLLLLQLFIAVNTVISLTFWSAQRKNQELSQKWNQAENRARLDPLTQIYNRRGLEEKAAALLNKSPRRPLSLLVLDIDHFKEINDLYGHDVGDLVLVCFVRTLRAAIRDDDVLARIGGEEFAIIMDGLAEKSAVKLAERIRQSVAQTKIELEAGKYLAVTVSIGVKENDAAYSIHEWLKITDKLLYKAKKSGRNRVMASIKIA